MTDQELTNAANKLYDKMRHSATLQCWHRDGYVAGYRAHEKEAAEARDEIQNIVPSILHAH